MNRLYFRIALLLALVAMFAMVPATVADTIVAGHSSTNLNPATPLDLPTGPPLATISGPYVGAFVGTPAGTYTAAVFRDSGNGALDFVYNFSNTAGNVVSVSMASFAGFTVDAFATGTGNAPVLVSRPVDSLITFSFVSPTADNNVGPGQSSQTLILATNAFRFDTGVFSLLGAGTASVQAFAPTGNPIPEPSSMLLFGTGLSLCAGKLGSLISKQRRFR